MFKVLIVEDTLLVREELRDILTLEGYIVFESENGRIGFEIALKEKPDLIISDILMPDLCGFKMFEKLQNNTETVGIPLIFLTAKAETEDIRRGMNIGAEDYIKIAEACEYIVIENIPKFNEENINKQKRFITLIDILYEKKIPLMTSSSVDLENFGSSKALTDSFKRTLSRLYELTSIN